MVSERKARAHPNSLLSLHDMGQAAWLDYLAQPFVSEGKLDKLVVQDGITGVTSNPSIFEKAIAEGADYDASLEDAERHGDMDVILFGQ